jgi:PEP-CTERM motif-containing protein
MVKRYTMWTVRSSSLACLLLFAAMAVAPSVAKAAIVPFTIFADLSGLPGVTVNGTLDIDTTAGDIAGGFLTVSQGYVNDFDTPFACGPSCVLLGDFHSPDSAFMFLDFAPGTLVGYTGGALAGDSFLEAASGEPYSLVNGTATMASTPEPGFYGILTLGLGGLLVAGWRRQRSPQRGRH